MQLSSPLDKEAQEVRLLTLLPGSFASEIRVCIQNWPFSGVYVPDFEAFSYTWGSAENLMTIFGETGQKTLSITQNLARALPYLRYEDRPRLLWVDAICINQQILKKGDRKF
jgi:hypothetical protein